MPRNRTAGIRCSLRNVLIFTGCIFSSIFSLSAAQAGTPETPASLIMTDLAPRLTKLTLQHCIDLALQNNHSRAVSRYGIEIAEAQHRQALSAYWPQVGIKATYSVMDEEPNFIFPGRSISMPQGYTIPVNTPTGQIQLSSLPVPDQNVKLMDKKNFVASLNATLPLLYRRQDKLDCSAG